MSKGTKIKLIVLAIISIFCIVFVYNDYFIYKTPILKITNIETKEEKSPLSDEIHYTQNITGIIKNGKYKGKIVKFTNLTSTSGVYDEQLHKRSELLVSLSKDGSEIVRVLTVKRDKYLVILSVIFIDLLLIIGNKKGLKTLISLIVNIAISALSIIVFKSSSKISMLLLYIIVSIIFIVISLFITSGKNKKTYAAIASSIVSLFVSFSLIYLIIHLFGKDIFIWNMSYIEAVRDYRNFFYVSILLCGLGAIMDISITISSSLYELILKDKKITKSSLLKSGKEISKDIVGTMINVMLYTCYTPIVPTVLLTIKNKLPLIKALNLYGNLELLIILCGCISIVLSIPISLFVSLLILKNDKVRRGK